MQTQIQMPKVGIALDQMTFIRAEELVRMLAPRVAWWKVHMLADEYEALNMGVLKLLAGDGKLLLDVKLCDTPDTVKGRALAFQKKGIYDAITVQVGDDIGMVKAAVSTGLAVFAVTVLTSQDPKLFQSLNGRTVEEAVHTRAIAARDAGAYGIVSSAPDLGLVTGICKGTNVVSLVPGTRLRGSEHHDQKRVVEPGEAAAHGGNQIHIYGREVTQADDPAAVLDRIEANILAKLAA